MDSFVKARPRTIQTVCQNERSTWDVHAAFHSHTYDILANLGGTETTYTDPWRTDLCGSKTVSLLDYVLCLRGKLRPWRLDSAEMWPLPEWDMTTRKETAAASPRTPDQRTTRPPGKTRQRLVLKSFLGMWSGLHRVSKGTGSIQASVTAPRQVCLSLSVIPLFSCELQWNSSTVTALFVCTPLLESPAALSSTHLFLLTSTSL